MILSLLVSILVPQLIALLFIFLVWPHRARLSSLPLRICVAVGIGLGLFSCTYFVQLLVLGPSRTTFIFIQIALLAALSAILVYRVKSRKTASQVETPAHTTSNPILRLALSIVFVVALVSASLSFIFISLKHPHGEWDAWAVYNMKARFMFKAGENWKDLYTEPLYWSGTDYPLLIPTAIAGIWTLIGRESVAVPPLVAMLFTLGTAGVATSALSVLRSRCQGLLAGLILLCTPFFVQHGAHQYSDIPIGFFFLATFVFLGFHQRSAEGDNRFLLLAGVTAGLAAWTKNEGLLFALAIVVARFAVLVPRRGLKPFVKEMVFFAIGIIPVVTVVLILKMGLGQPNGLISPTEGPPFMEKITELARYRIVAKAYFEQTFTFGNFAVSVVPLLVVYLLLLGTEIEKSDKATIIVTFGVLGIMLAGYYMIYVLSPRDVAWHVLTSLNRLCSQLWPSFLFGFFLIARTPEAALMKKRIVAEPSAVSS
jgi:hypothetical protein